MKADKVMFLGNSITLHPPAPDDGWPNECGMAASAPDKDYVHLLLTRFAEASGNPTPEVMVQNIADFERQHDTMDIDSVYREHVEFKPDIVVLAIGENVAALTTEASQATFREAVIKLLSLLKQSSGPDIIVRSCFWPDETKDKLLRQACEETGGTFVNIGFLGVDKSNFASSERPFKNVDVGNHPGDRGMAAIADTIWKAVEDNYKEGTVS